MGLADTVHDFLQGEVLVAAEVAGDRFPMLLRRDEDVAVQGRVTIEEGDRLVVLVDHVMREVGVAGEQLADEAPPGEASAKLLEVHRARSMDRHRLANGVTDVGGAVHGSMMTPSLDRRLQPPFSTPTNAVLARGGSVREDLGRCRRSTTGRDGARPSACASGLVYWSLLRQQRLRRSSALFS